MEAEKSPFDAVRAMMLENLEKVEKVGGATQSYIAPGIFRRPSAFRSSTFSPSSRPPQVMQLGLAQRWLARSIERVELREISARNP